MRRSAALAGLSRDHHQALVVAKGLARAGPQNAEQARGRFVEFLAQHELAHFELEERVLLPALPDEPAARTLAQRTREEHARLREAMQRLREAAGEPDLALLHETGTLLAAHVRMEERELFPLLEARLDPGALARLGERLHGAR